MKLVIVRHAETECNVKGILQGHKDTKLNEQGCEQARRVAKRLKWMKIDAAYVSDLMRTKETALEILKYHKKTKVNYCRELREKCFGVMEGKPVKEWKELQEVIYGSFVGKKAEGGENNLELNERVIHFLKKIIQKHPSGTVLIVTHGGPMRTIYIKELNMGADDRETHSKVQPQNCAITILEIDGKGKHEVKAFNCVKHLSEK